MCVILFQSGDAPLHIALREDHIQVAEVLLSKGADVNSWDKVISIHCTNGLHAGVIIILYTCV